MVYFLGRVPPNSAGKSMKYPVPSYAVNLWIAGDNLMVAFPGQGPAQQGHTLKFPASPAGLKTLISILNDRQHADDLRLANRGTPCQTNVESDEKYKAWLKAMGAGKAKDAAELAEAEALLAELGL